MRSRGDAGTRFVLIELTDPDDPRLREVAGLLQRTFADPNMVLGLDRMREFLRANQPGAARRFHVLVLDTETHARVVGCSLFSYVPASNCGFSEYLVVERDVRGHGLGRQLFDARKTILDADATAQGQPGCRGIFIEVDSPVRTPAALLEAERRTSLDALERLRIFRHLGFSRVDLAYVQPPLSPEGEAVEYLDLLFAPFEGELRQIPSAWVFDTLAAIWSGWSPLTVADHLEALRTRLTGGAAQLVDPLETK